MGYLSGSLLLEEGKKIRKNKIPCLGQASAKLEEGKQNQIFYLCIWAPSMRSALWREKRRLLGGRRASLEGKELGINTRSFGGFSTSFIHLSH